jgi:cyanophycin synthetase
MMSLMQKCLDCGNAQVNHRMERISAVANHLFGGSMDTFWRALEGPLADPLYNSFTPLLMNALVALRLARFADAPNDKTIGRTRVLWEEANRRGIRMREFRLFGIGSGNFLATYQGEKKSFIGLPRPGSLASSALSWMDNKQIVREKFSAAEIPTPHGGVATSVEEALISYKRLRPPLITKPETGSRSRHTTTHIRTEEELIEAFEKAAQLSRWVIVEEELEGFVYRGTLVGGKLVATLRREPPFVTADGVHTLAELIEVENKNPKRNEKVFHTILLTEASHQEIKRQALTLESVPAKGRVVTLGQKSSRGIGGGTSDVSDLVHPDNRAMLEKAASVLEDPLVGIDFIIKDVAKSWKEQERSGVIECNSMPFIDLHYEPLRGESRNVAGPLWDIVFPTSMEKV